MPRRRRERRIPARPRIRQLDVDFLCLAVFGARYLPYDMAVRIAKRKEAALAIAQGFATADRAREQAYRRLEVSEEGVEALAV